MKLFGIILIAIPLCLAKISNGPKNTVGQLGENVTLTCEASSPEGSVRWRNNAGDTVYISNKGGVKDDFKPIYEVRREGNR